MKRLLTLLTIGSIALHASVVSGQGLWVEMESPASSSAQFLRYGDWVIRADAIRESGSGESAHMIALGDVLLMKSPDLSVHGEKAILSGATVKFEIGDTLAKPRVSAVKRELNLSAQEISVDLNEEKVVLVQPGRTTE